MYENEDYFIPIIWEGDGEHPSPNYSTRYADYGITGLPTAAFNGDTFDLGGGGDVLGRYQAIYGDLINISSPMEIDVLMNVTSNGNLEIISDVLMTETIAADDYRIIFLLTYYYDFTYHSTVFAYYEEDFDLTTIGSSEQFIHEFTPDPGLDPALSRAVVLVQAVNSSNSRYNMYPILQAGMAYYPLIAPNPIANLEMELNDTANLDLTNYFYFQGNPVAADLSVQSSNTSIVEATLTGTDLTLNSFNTGGNVQIDIMGEYNGYSAISSFEVFVVDPQSHYIVILDFDPTPNGSALQTALESLYPAENIYLTDDINAFPLTSNADAVFVLLGIFENNFALTELEAGPLAFYLDGGGNVYMEGGDTWYYDIQTTVHPYFNIDAFSDGGADLSLTTGHDFLEGMNWSYSGENWFIDRMDPITPAFTIFTNTIVGYNCGVAYDSGTYKTVGTSFEITGLDGTNSLEDALEGIMNFFDVVVVESEDDIVPVKTATLGQNYPNPFNPTTKIYYSVFGETVPTELVIYNLKGQKVKQLVNDDLSSGQYSVVWNGKDDYDRVVSSGVYFYKMKSGIYTDTKKMILMK